MNQGFGIKDWASRPRYNIVEISVVALVVAAAISAVAYRRMTTEALALFREVHAAVMESPLPTPKIAEQGPPRGDTAYRHRYEFTSDWFTRNIPVWEQAMSPYRGRAGVRYLEVGVFEGRALLWMLEHVLTDPTSRATAIDISSGDYEGRYRSNLEHAGCGGKVTTLKAPSRAALRELPRESFDIAYIDGSHATADVLEDAVLSWQVLKPGGLLIFDDYRWIGSLHAGHAREAASDWPKPAIDAFCRCFRGKFDVVHNGYQLILGKRAGAPGSGDRPRARASHRRPGRRSQPSSDEREALPRMGRDGGGLGCLRGG
jgi:hypothetical protein